MSDTSYKVPSFDDLPIKVSSFDDLPSLSSSHKRNCYVNSPPPMTPSKRQRPSRITTTHLTPSLTVLHSKLAKKEKKKKKRKKKDGKNK